jgi:hypothetical protein
MRVEKLSAAVVAVGLLTVAAAGTAFAQGYSHDPVRPKVVAKTHQPTGKPHKASSFAPHPTTRRVFGDPIQPPILHKTPPPPKGS